VSLARLDKPRWGAKSPYADPEVGERCIQCGRRRLPDGEEQWQEFAVMPRERAEPPMLDVLRRAIQGEATEDALLRHVPYFDKDAPPGDWIRKLVAERGEDGEDSVS
jgi:hypothetical protein